MRGSVTSASGYAALLMRHTLADARGAQMPCAGQGPSVGAVLTAAVGARHGALFPTVLSPLSGAGLVRGWREKAAFVSV